jgi:hypothetical protein
MSANPVRYHCEDCNIIIDIEVVFGADQPSDVGEAKCPWSGSPLMDLGQAPFKADPMSGSPLRYVCSPCDIVFDIELQSGADQASNLGEPKCPWCRGPLTEAPLK